MDVTQVRADIAAHRQNGREAAAKRLELELADYEDTHDAEPVEAGPPAPDASPDPGEAVVPVAADAAEPAADVAADAPVTEPDSEPTTEVTE